MILNKPVQWICVSTLCLCLAMTTGRSFAEEGKGRLRIEHEGEQYDSLLSVWYRENIVSYDKFVSDFIDIDVSQTYNPQEALPDSVYRARLQMLASVIQLPYNDIVRQYILRYTIKYRSMMTRILGLAQYYMPIFEQELDLNGLPLELKILPLIESTLNPTIMSRAGAGGLWQFMLRTGKSYGLETNSFVDERFDPVKSTQAACKFLKDYYQMFGDWTLVIAAYNCGAGNVTKAIKRAGNAKTYWDIYEYLPRETRGYIPSFIAMTYAYTFHKAHNLEPIAPPITLATDTVMVREMLHFNQVSSTIDVPIDVLRDLNPQYKMDIIPAKTKEYSLVLPMRHISSFAENEKEIYAKHSIYLQSLSSDSDSAAKVSSQNSSASSTSGTYKTTYKIKKDDNLGAIAARYGVTVKQIMQRNNIKDARKIQIGQVLKIK